MQQSRQPWHYRRKVCVLRPPSESADRLADTRPTPIRCHDMSDTLIAQQNRMPG
jgi:hypothetical protein